MQVQRVLNDQVRRTGLTWANATQDSLQFSPIYWKLDETDPTEWRGECSVFFNVTQVKKGKGGGKGEGKKH